MSVYLDLVFLLNFLVDFLLILTVDRLFGYPLKWKRSAVSALTGGIYGAVCLLHGFEFLGALHWRLIVLCILSVIAFGWNHTTIKRGAVLILASMALGGIAVCIDQGGFLGIVLPAAALLALSIPGVLKKTGIQQFVPVELIRAGRRYLLTALQDTGNLLRDPVTGQQVMIVGPETAKDVLGLTPMQLAEPIRTMQEGIIPGLRLIPYSTVGQPHGMLLAICFDKVVVSGVERGSLVAFSPNGFGAGCTYQALTGGEI